jgi:hypothetical protein
VILVGEIHLLRGDELLGTVATVQTALAELGVIGMAGGIPDWKKVEAGRLACIRLNELFTARGGEPDQYLLNLWGLFTIRLDDARREFGEDVLRAVEEQEDVT